MGGGLGATSLGFCLYLMKKYILLIMIIFFNSAYLHSQEELKNGLSLQLTNSLNNQNNFRISYGFSDVFLAANKAELIANNFSISLIRDFDKSNKYYVSINPLFWITAKTINEICDSNSIVTIPFMLGVVILQIFPNTKLEPFLYKDKVRLRFGLNTDYYLLNKPAKIYSEFELGLSISLFNTSISVSGVIPISKGFLNKDLKGFFNLNLAYKFDETPLTDYLVHFSK